MTRRKPNTRTRILAACRELFNARGPADVTTAEIAAAVGINEGNLYYYFQRKEQILQALFEEFEQRLDEVATAYRAYGQDPGRYRDYLGGWFNLMWEWRFFYRDGGAVYRLSPTLRSRIKAVSDGGHDQIRRALEGMQKAGLIRATPDDIESLIVNTWIVSTYWIDYLRSRRGITHVTRQHVDWGAKQVMSLYAPYLTPAGRALVEQV